MLQSCHRGRGSVQIWRRLFSLPPRNRRSQEIPFAGPPLLVRLLRLRRTQTLARLGRWTMTTNVVADDPQQHTTTTTTAVTASATTIANNVVPSVEEPRREIQQQLMHSSSSSSTAPTQLPRPKAAVGKPPRSERKPRHKKSGKSNKQHPQVTSSSNSSSRVAPEDPGAEAAAHKQHQQQRPPGKKTLQKQWKRQLRQEHEAAKIASPTDFLLQMAQRVATATGSVQIVGSAIRSGEPSLADAISDGLEPLNAAVAHLPGRKRIQIVTSCQSLPSLDERQQAIMMKDVNNSINTNTDTTPFIVSTTRIFIKPLLILDLNGILCHRIRRRRNFHRYGGADVVDNSTSITTATSTAPPPPPAPQDEREADLPLSAYRPTVGPVIAQTPIVARPQLEEWLTYMDRHFCLAVWTSGKNKTAHALVRALVPPDVAQRFLFVWAQHHCRAELPVKANNGWSCHSNDSVSSCSGSVGGGGDGESSSEPVKIHPSEIIYKKDLKQVWQEYPLWNASNTLLIDDSPDKCVAWRENAVHPPRLNGLQRRRRHEPGQDDRDGASSSTTSSSHHVTDDEVNVARQQLFFEQLVQHWTEHPLVEEWDTEAQDAVLREGGDRLLTFLREHAVGHMGWTEPSSATMTTTTTMATLKE